MKNKIKHIIVFIIALTIIAGGCVFVFRARLIAHFIPEVEQIDDIHIIVKDDTSYVSARLVIKNQSFFKIEIDTIDYKVSLFNKTYLQSKRPLGILLPGHGNDTVDFPLKIPYLTILKDLKAERKKGDSTGYSINVFLQYSTFFGKSEIPIIISEKIKIPQPPELKVEEIKWKKVRFKSIHAIAKIKIINHSPIALSIKNMNYSINILERGKLKGNYNGPITIKPIGTTYIHLPLEINVTNIGKTIFEILINKDIYNYTLTLNAIMESSDPLKVSFHIDLVKSGKIELKK